MQIYILFHLKRSNKGNCGVVSFVANINTLLYYTAREEYKIFLLSPGGNNVTSGKRIGVIVWYLK
jgi:hypothetical protein